MHTLRNVATYDQAGAQAMDDMNGVCARRGREVRRAMIAAAVLAAAALTDLIATLTVASSNAARLAIHLGLAAALLVSFALLRRAS